MFAQRAMDRNWMPKLALWRQKLNVFISLRQRMAHFIDNIAYYLQVDVLETHYTQLMKRVSQAEDFQGAHRAHEKYIHGLVSACFLDHHVLCTSLEELFMHCISLVNITNKLGWPCQEPSSLARPRGKTHEVGWRGESVTQENAAFHLDQLDMSEVLGLTTNFDRRFHFLFTILSTKKQEMVLSGLLLRLDYNGYFTHTMGGVEKV
uniref:Spindle pole body component n=1 Tax=Eutreptiella gymnastica TaxID=73025 RepID=A0A7S4CJ80_9EUGL